MTPYAGGTGSVPVGMVPAEPRGRGAGSWIRTVLATGAGLVAVGLLSLSGVLAVFALVAVSPDHPGRAFVVLLSVPEVRQDAADSLVADVEAERDSAVPPATRAVVVEATAAALGDPEVLGALADMPVVVGRLDPEPWVDALAVELGAQAGAAGDPEVRRVLSILVEEVPEVTTAPVSAEGPDADVLDFVGTLGDVRRYGLIASAVVAGLGLVALLVAAAIAVHRGLAATLAASASLVGTALALAPVEWLLARGGSVGGTLAHAVAAAGRFAGTGLVWTLLLASLVPPALWWAARSVRRTG